MKFESKNKEIEKSIDDLAKYGLSIQRVAPAYFFGHPQQFSNPFKALSWCYENPMREIEYELKAKNGRVMKLLERFNNERQEFEFANMKNKIWDSDFIPDYDGCNGFYDGIFDWKNIKEHKEEPKERNE